MFEECKLEEWAESIEPSSTCAQLQAAWIFTMLILVAGDGAQAGGWNGATASADPSHAQMKPPASRVG
jgi:hypothetical protein